MSEERVTVPREEAPEQLQKQYPNQKEFILVKRAQPTVAAPAPLQVSRPVQQSSVLQSQVVSPQTSFFQGRKPAYTQDDVPEEIKAKFPTIGTGFTGSNIIVRNLGKVDKIPEQYLQKKE